MQNEQQSSETFNVSGGEVEKNSFDGNNAPIIKDSSGSVRIYYNYSIFYNYSNAIDSSPHCGLDSIRNESANTIPSQVNGLYDSKIIIINDKLHNLLIQKRELEIKLEYLELEISQIESVLKSETNPSLTMLLHWLSSGKDLAEKYGKITLRGFQSLKREAEEKGDLDDFYFEVESYLELIYFSFKTDNKIFLQEPAISPTFADPDTYENVSADVYKKVFEILKEYIPVDNIKPSFRSKLEDHFDVLLKRLQAYF